ncbi:hypothetical protein CMV_013720 [Castanea mollissima]|uniref:Uncharacterized protein n=1 Tax=Castanea mollissima TaxID=60419 RepID=A0A8J4VVA1_9ROSI|nr:hypothetical protein CMV_013720 [Castanea mollissima]
METEAIQGIVLNLPTPKEAHWNLESFSKMQHLKLLIIDNVYLLHDPKHLPNGLRILDWGNYPSKFFPSSFQSKSFQRLKSIRIRKPLKLVETPVFTEVPFLEKLVLEDCLNLSKHWSSVKLTDSQGVIDMFFTVIRKHLQGLSLKDRYCHEGFDSSYHIVIPGSKIGSNTLRQATVQTRLKYREDHLIITMWDLSYNLNTVMFEDAKQCTYDVLSKALYCRYAQDAQHVDQNNCRRVPRRVCPLLMTVEGHWQRRFVLVSRRMEELYLGKNLLNLDNVIRILKAFD